MDHFLGGQPRKIFTVNFLWGCKHGLFEKKYINLKFRPRRVLGHSYFQYDINLLLCDVIT